MTTQSPAQAWERMTAGNARFVEGAPEHPHQDADRRHRLAAAQKPQAVLFGCSDSRLAAEIIFDMGLGDLFVVRNAGQVTGESIMGSIEYAVGVLNVPLIVVLSHDECGAVRAAIDSLGPDSDPLPPHIWRLISPIVPAVQHELRAAESNTLENISAENVGRRHLEQTVAQILRHSEMISDAVAAGTVGIVGANYRLAEGRVEQRVAIGIEA
ncbi:carbonic anhydrase [Microbacterium halophytorum]|uniref:carbonic anhydrase n=1 Tax=Microbacterium halophytorum TaxID=2067568 RepID=UPI000CFD0C26|nr:carbonic anhydrase [Microbacterium halophytorum]